MLVEKLDEGSGTKKLGIRVHSYLHEVMQPKKPLPVWGCKFPCSHAKPHPTCVHEDTRPQQQQDGPSVPIIRHP